ncbi:MAG: hypothetical protein KF760_33245 [Candidatus Eremiobacteraeota bacterium]|nr:hypothetical protein [Candidatus Eremiobacteraeota bacterium]MCW5869072.1 hypothetical protein [Candidatus Eremiobacteraeota bacterium]
MSEANLRVFPRAEGEYLAWFQVPGGSFEQCVALNIGLDGACLLLPPTSPPESGAQSSTNNQSGLAIAP